MIKQCEYDGCSEPATTTARGRRTSHYNQPGHPKVGHYCDTHADMIADEGSPEYVVDCPNCSCRFGVN